MTMPYLFLPHELTDEAAAYLSELLNDLAVAFDGQSLRSDRPLLRRAQPTTRHRTLVP